MGKHPFQQAVWATSNVTGELNPLTGEQSLQMKHSDATATPLLRDESIMQAFGADIIRFPPGGRVGLHTHPGAHALFVLRGNGFVAYYDEKYDLKPGLCYLIPSHVPHAIDAAKDEELVLIAIGNDHQLADSEARLEIVEGK